MSATRSAILAAVAALLLPDGLGNIQLAQSPTQFDSSLRLAPTSFVWGVLGNFRGTIGLNVSTALTPNQVGYGFQTQTAGITVTLPNAASTINGGVIQIFNNSGGNVTLTAGNFNTAYGAGVTSIVLPPSSTITLSCDNTSWNAIGASGSIGGAIRPQSASGVSQWTNLIISAGTGGSISLPTGGTWAYAFYNQGTVQSGVGIAAGATVLLTGAAAGGAGISNAWGFCWRIA